MQILNELPSEFTTWRQFWQAIKEGVIKSIHEGGKVYFVSKNFSHQAKATYSFESMDFIKARVFEEIEPNLPTDKETWLLKHYTQITPFMSLDEAEKLKEIIKKLYKIATNAR